MSEHTETPVLVVPMTQAVTIPAVEIPPEHHASRLHAVFSVLAGMLHVLESPAVLALLPAPYRGYAAAIVAVDQVATEVVTEASETPQPTS